MEVHKDELKLKHPFTFCVVGPSGSGKTVFVQKLLKEVNKMFTPIPGKIFFFYSIWQSKYTDILNDNPAVEFIQDFTGLAQMDPTEINLIILDDLMEETKDNSDIAKLFTKASHHRNISVIFLTQNLFLKGKQTRTISLNSHYMAIFKNPRDKSQFSHLASQMFPGESSFLKESFSDATSTPHGYLFLDFKQETPENLRVRTNILEEKPIVYIKK
jgi:ABC-type proline/glycine betaine transport system ATPase subunit